MKITIALALFLGTNNAINLGNHYKQTWVELPDCPDTLTKSDVKLDSDLTNALYATCKGSSVETYKAFDSKAAK